MTFSIPELTRSLAIHPLDFTYQLWIFLALFAGFAIKVPLFPLHTWLPLAHTQAPAAGSVLLAGVLLKLGTYGFTRFNIPMLPDATAACAPWILWLSVIGIIYGALVALTQTDMKRLIAYSSVSHLGFCMLGLFALGTLSVQGSVLQMVNHGLSTGGLFALVGMIYERYHTREIAKLGGLCRRLPILTLHVCRVYVLQHRPAGAERLRRRVRDSAGHVRPGVECRSRFLGIAFENDRRGGGLRRFVGGLVHVVAGRANLLRPASRTCPRSRTRSRSGRSCSSPGCGRRPRVGMMRMVTDRPPTTFLPRRSAICHCERCWPWPR